MTDRDFEAELAALRAERDAAETRAVEVERDEGEAWAQWNEMAEKLAQAEARSAALEAKLTGAINHVVTCSSGTPDSVKQYLRRAVLDSTPGETESGGD